MGSYDPREEPERGIVGWNCILPGHRGKGYGRAQIEEILRIFRSRGIRKAFVITLDADLYVPAQRMYEACGFVRARTTEERRIEYELEL